MELQTIKYLDEVLQVEDIKIVESVQKGMNTPAFKQGASSTISDGRFRPVGARRAFPRRCADACAKCAAAA